MIQAECELHAKRAPAAVRTLEPLLTAVDPKTDPVDAGRVRAVYARALAAAAGGATERSRAAHADAVRLLTDAGAPGARFLAKIQ
jgi:hypothetical protein